MKLFGVLILLGSAWLLCGCDPTASFVGHWEFDLKASMEANPDVGDWSAEENGAFTELRADGTYKAVSIETDQWKESGWEGNWEVESYNMPISSDDSLDEFLASLSPLAKNYIPDGQKPKYELVFYPQTNFGRKTAFPEPQRRIVLNIEPDRLITCWNSHIQIYLRTK